VNLTDADIEKARTDLFELRVEHRDLDQAISHMLNGPYTDQLRLCRMKKRKLKLKDSIARLESMVIPDIDA
jgi:hypothetical protein